MNFEDIKFRAWHENKMFNVIKFDFSTEDVYLEDLISFESFWVQVDEVDLMMYTGLQDKNGKDIYEGDLVSYTEVDGYKWSTMRLTRDLVTEITVSIKTEFEEYYGGEDTEISYENIEIIGNKYENPELLQS